MYVAFLTNFILYFTVCHVINVGVEIILVRVTMEEPSGENPLGGIVNNDNDLVF